jgi:hypothetical protein
VRRDEVAQARAVEALHEVAGGGVVEVAEASRDAVLQAEWIRPLHQHVEVVVALDHERVAAGELVLHVAGGRAEVGEHAQAQVAVREHVLHRLARIVRHRERLDQDRADREPRVRVDEPHQHRGKVRREPLRRAAREVHRDRVALGEARDAADVVVMLVGHADAVDRGRRHAARLELRNRRGQREAAIHHHARARALDDQPVARAAAAQRGETHAAYLSCS